MVASNVRVWLGKVRDNFTLEERRGPAIPLSGQRESTSENEGSAGDFGKSGRYADQPARLNRESRRRGGQRGRPDRQVRFGHEPWEETALMNSNKNKVETVRIGDKNVSLTPSAALLYRKIGPSPAPRMLTKEEIELLRRSVKEAVEVSRAAFASSKAESET